jgi:hypothetical protein
VRPVDAAASPHIALGYRHTEKQRSDGVAALRFS